MKCKARAHRAARMRTCTSLPTVMPRPLISPSASQRRHCLKLKSTTNIAVVPDKRAKANTDPGPITPGNSFAADITTETLLRDHAVWVPALRRDDVSSRGAQATARCRRSSSEAGASLRPRSISVNLGSPRYSAASRPTATRGSVHPSRLRRRYAIVTAATRPHLLCESPLRCRRQKTLP
jgi:hypothetical protein